MYRRCIQRLKEWANRNEHSPMILRGARQVGKTTLVRMLAEDLSLKLIEINMEERQSFIEMFQHKEKARDLLELILIENGVMEAPEDVLIFFDEAQETPSLYPYLRYFKEKAPEYKVIAAGSLFEFELTRSETGQGPTGRVEYSYLEPMTFEEFLMAVNPAGYKKLLSLPLFEPQPEAFHKMFSKLFQEYLVTGGMPAVVIAKVNGYGPQRFDEIKSDIITGYIEDLPKYAQLTNKKYDAELLERLFKIIWGNPANGMKYSELAPNNRAEKVKQHLDVLVDARVIRRSLHTSQNKPPLSASENPKNYKYFALDVGLCYSFMELNPVELYVTADINDLARGIITEQYVAQTLTSLPPFHRKRTLNHWERQKRSSVAEVDFVVSLGGKVIPIECKSGKSGKMRSLREMLAEKHFPQALRLYAGNYEILHWDIQSRNGTNNGQVHQTEIISLPHYMLERFCMHWNNQAD